MSRLSRTPIAAFLLTGAPLLALLTACGPDPADEAAGSYVAAMQPVLTDNVALAQDYLDMAGRIKKGELDGGGVAEKMARDIGPLAGKIHRGALAVHPADTQLADLHAQLVNTWSDRAKTYAAMSAAWAAGDDAAYETARASNLQVKVAEETAFGGINAWLGAHGQYLDQYP